MQSDKIVFFLIFRNRLTASQVLEQMLASPATGGPHNIPSGSDDDELSGSDEEEQDPGIQSEEEILSQGSQDLFSEASGEDDDDDGDYEDGDESDDGDDDGMEEGDEDDSMDEGDDANEDENGGDDQDESEGGDEIADAAAAPAAGAATRRARAVPPRQVFAWEKRHPREVAMEDNELSPDGDAITAHSPLEMFFTMFDDEILTHILDETNRLRVQTRRRVSAITMDELKVFIGITFVMGVVNMPSRRMFWSPHTRLGIVADYMTCNRFEEIFSLLHLCDNTLIVPRGEAGYDRIIRFRFLVDKLNENYEKNAKKSSNLSVDEMMIPFKGRNSLKMYMKNKPSKWGIKLFGIASSTGYVYKFYVYGDNTLPEIVVSPDIGESGKVIIRLAEEFPAGSHIFCDNYFMSPALIKYLGEKQKGCTGTIRKPRRAGCQMKTDNEMRREGRGAMDYRTDRDSNVCMCQWMDNRIVTLASNRCGVRPTMEVRRYDRREKKYINVQCPSVVVAYNKHMGGLDKMDMLVSLYRNPLKTIKWYKRVILHLTDMTVVNCWLLYRTKPNNETLPLLKFKMDMAVSLIQGAVPQPQRPLPPPGQFVRRRLSEVTNDVRYGNHLAHMPEVQDLSAAVRCQYPPCKRRTRMSCLECRIFLCCDAVSNCFKLFHTRP